MNSHLIIVSGNGRECLPEFGCVAADHCVINNTFCDVTIKECVCADGSLPLKGKQSIITEAGYQVALDQPTTGLCCFRECPQQEPMKGSTVKILKSLLVKWLTSIHFGPPSLISFQEPTAVYISQMLQRKTNMMMVSIKKKPSK